MSRFGSIDQIFLSLSLYKWIPTQALYEAILSWFKEKSPNFKPDIAITDFESAIQNAVVNTYDDTNIRGCVFHFKQAILRKVNKIGLAKTYKDNPAFRKFVRILMCLNFLPAQDIPTALQTLRQHVLPLSHSEGRLTKMLLTYIQKFWIETVGADRFSVFRASSRTIMCVRVSTQKLEAESKFLTWILGICGEAESYYCNFYHRHPETR